MRILATHNKRNHPGWLEHVELLPGWQADVDRNFVTLRASSSSPLFRDLKWAWRLFRASKNYDMLLTGSERLALILALLQKFIRGNRRVGHVLMECMWTLPEGRRLAGWKRRLLLRWVAESTDRIVVYSRNQIDAYAECFGICSEKCVFVHSHSTLYGAVYPPSCGDYIFSGGYTNRDYPTFLEAIRGLPYRVVLCLRSTRMLGRDIPRNIEVFENVSEDTFNRLMAGSAFVVVPLKGGLEPGGRQVFQNAMTMGKAVIVTDASATDYIENNVTGLLTPAGDAAALREAIVTLMGNMDLTHKIGMEGQKIASAFIPEQFFERIFAIVKESAYQRAVRRVLSTRVPPGAKRDVVNFKNNRISRPLLCQSAVSGLGASVSVIVATKDRAAVLERMLKSLLEQTTAPDEIIVIDQSKTDDSERLLREIAAEVQSSGCQRPQIQYVCAPELLGAAAARNLGIDLSTSSTLVFLDDDVLLEHDFLAELLSVYRRFPTVSGVSGIITNYERPPLRSRLLETVFCIGVFHDERLPIYWGADELRGSEPIPIRKVSGCVMSVSRAALGDKRFDGNYRGAGAEDVELSWRLSEVSPFLLAPRARLTHLRTQSGPQRQHWLGYTAACQHYLYYKLWRTGINNTLCFAWLNCGFVIIACVSSMRRLSFAPFRTLVAGIRQSYQLISAVSGEPRSGKVSGVPR